MKYSKNVSYLLISLALLATSHVVQAEPTPSEKLPTEAVTKIEQILTQYYGNDYDNQHQCLRYTYKYTTDYGTTYQDRYCMKIDSITQKTVNGEPILYMMVSSDMVEDDEQPIGHVSQGLDGLFILGQQPTNGQWRLSASTPYIPNGQWGKSQMSMSNGDDGFKLVAVGADKFGWVGEFYGSGAGGESSSQWVMYAPIGNKIQDVAELELSHSYMGYEEWTETEGNVKILDTSKMSNGFYPLRVNLIHQVTPAIEGEPVESKTTTTRESYWLTFDAHSNKYVR
ncbi:hypothetical protein [Psychrobacter sp. I-STPA10]|uniref:hypothetical protein n=1 Tax=Psychrobacter sp. I-STPA10 TaxID=2585769 RepID=UPI001E2D18CF|nr:hypothetical protein [Psychrobacter sp. I-STPA10]